MGFKNREDEEIACFSSLSGTLLLATVCIIGLPVDVHVKDGSVYSGIFYTASLETDFSIVLKKAKLSNKGKSKTNVASGSVIETLVILSADLVQVVAKGVLLPSGDIHGNLQGENVNSSVDTIPSSGDLVGESKKSAKSGTDRRHIDHKRNSINDEICFANGVRIGQAGKDQETRNAQANHTGNAFEAKHGKQDGINMKKNHDGSDFVANERQFGAHSLGHDEQDANFHHEDDVDVRSPSSSVDSTSEQAKPIEEDKTLSKSFANGGCDDASRRPSSINNSSSQSPPANVYSESCQDSLASIPLQSLESNRSTKEFKLNPGAKIFSPSFAKPVPVALPVVPTIANMAYVPSNPHVVAVPGTALPAVGISPYAPPSVPSKHVPYSSLTAGNAVSGSQFSQPIAGHMGDRPQPHRYAAQHQPVPAGSMFVNLNSQVMLGPLRHPAYVQPVSLDLVQGAPAVSPVHSSPLLTAQQVQYTKHQGTVAGQSVQLCMPQPLAANGQQPYAVPGHFPVLQPPFPMAAVPGSNGFFGPKLP